MSKRANKSKYAAVIARSGDQRGDCVIYGCAGRVTISDCYNARDRDLARFVVVSIVNGMSVFRLDAVQENVTVGCLSPSEMVIEDRANDHRQHRYSGQYGHRRNLSRPRPTQSS